MMQGSDWPVPTAPREPETARERLWRALPAVLLTLALHAGMAAWLLRAPAPWPRPPAAVSSAQSIEITFFDPSPPPPPARSNAASERADAIPFPTTRPTIAEASTEVRESPPPPTSAPIVRSEQLFGDIAGVAAGLSRPDAARTPRSNTRLPGRDDAFIDTAIRFTPPPPTPEQVATRFARLVVSTTAANSTTGLMGTIPGRDPLRETQAGHHQNLYLPRGCDDPENPNLSDDCMGIPKR